MNIQIGSAINGHSDRGVSWATHGMMRMEAKAMRALFKPTIQKILEVGTAAFLLNSILFSRVYFGATR